MTSREEEFLKSLRAIFRVEAGEHLETLTSGLLALEKASDEASRRLVIDNVFRAAHSLKGAARSVNLSDIESACQSLEDTFARWKRADPAPTAESLDRIHRTLDTISTSIAGASSRSDDRAAVDAPAAAPAPAAALPVFPDSASTGPASAPPATGVPTEIDTVRVPVSALDTRLLQAEELLTAKLVSAQRTSELETLHARIERWNKQWAGLQPQARLLRRSIERESARSRSPELASVLEFLEWNQDSMRSLEAAVQSLHRAMAQDRLLIDHLVDDLMESSKEFVMLPVSMLGALLPKTVRDLSRDQGKEAEFVLQGADVRIDKRVLDDMKDPLLHLLRNAVDHGVERPDARARAGKPSRATITLAVRGLGGHQIEMLLSDDGAGIDPARVKAAAVERGLITAQAAERLSDAEAVELVFEPDLSTRPIVTKMSGRGLGLAIVREATERLGGRLSIASRVGEGLEIRITLPVALSTFRGVLIRSEERLFVIPTGQIARVIRFRGDDVATVEGRETLAFEGRAVALVRLADVLHLPPAQRPRDAPAFEPALVLGSGESRLALAVDEIVEEREVLVKPLRKPLSRVRNLAGATVLGSGAIALVLNVPDLLKSARGVEPRRPAAMPEPASSVKAKRVLVAEDSITSRMLLKGILESAGYAVRTAVDGIDAYATLREDRFDLVVSDVEMPRMNGFDLTARIRADRALAHLPVVLVTALESREDRERGIDVGASAYLVKSSLDQSNLLDTLRRLA